MALDDGRPILGSGVAQIGECRERQVGEIEPGLGRANGEMGGGAACELLGIAVTAGAGDEKKKNGG